MVGLQLKKPFVFSRIFLLVCQILMHTSSHIISIWQTLTTRWFSFIYLFFLWPGHDSQAILHLLHFVFWNSHHHFSCHPFFFLTFSQLDLMHHSILIIFDTSVQCFSTWFIFNYVQGRQNHYTVTEIGAKIMVIDRFSNLLSLVNTHTTLGCTLFLSSQMHESYILVLLETEDQYQCIFQPLFFLFTICIYAITRYKCLFF